MICRFKAIRCCYQMYLRTFEIRVLKIYEIDPTYFLIIPVFAWQVVLRKDQSKIRFLNCYQYVIKSIRGGICHTICWYAKASNNYMKSWDKNKKLSNLQYWDVKKLYGWAISQKLTVNNFELIKDISQFKKIYDEENDKGYFLEVDVQYPRKPHDFQNNLAFLHEGMKIEKVENPLASLHDKSK